MFNKKIFIRLALLLLSGMLFFSSCVTTAGSGAPETASAATGSTEPLFFGQGSGVSSIEAIQVAKKDAARRAAEEMLGTAAVSGQREQLDSLFSSINDIEPYVIAGSQETVESRNTDGFYYHIGVKINLAALAAKLKSVDILGGQVDGKEGNVYRLADRERPADTAEPEESTAPSESGEEDVTQPDVPAAAAAEAAVDISAEELAVISSYLDSLTYMVYFNEETEADPFLTRTAVISANRYLENEDLEYVDLAQIERIKEDQQIVYEEETGEAVSIIQWIAHKLNADVYIEISLDTSSKTERNKYYGSATVNLNSFNASTAEGLGSAVYQTIPPAFSTISEDDALSNAVSAAVFNGMSEAVAKAEKEAAVAAARGFRYSLILMNTSDSRLIRDFEKKLERRVKNVKRKSFSPEESIFEVYLIGDIADLEDIIYDVAETIPGLEGILLVMQRGNSITFDTGM